MEIFAYPFFHNALVGAFLASILCGIVGTYIVTRRLVFISGGITHASFGGVGLGVYFGFAPIFSAIVFAVLSAFGIQWLSYKCDVREDSAIALFWTFGMSIGIICSFMTPSFMPGLPFFLFGSILAIGAHDIWLLGILTFTVSLVFILLHRTIVCITFDDVFARSRHLPVGFIEYLMMAIIAMTIVSTLRMVGIVMALSLLTVPQMTANLFTDSFHNMILISIVSGWLYCLCGLVLSYWLNVPSGAAIIFTSIVIYTICKAIKLICNKFNKHIETV